jgi:hypothetical protein
VDEAVVFVFGTSFAIPRVSVYLVYFHWSFIMSRFLLFALALGLIYSVSPSSINAQEKEERSHASNMRTTQDGPTDGCTFEIEDLFKKVAGSIGGTVGGGGAIDLHYAVRNGEALYSVATANGDLRFVNQGPSATKLRWFDPLRGEEEVRVLHPGQALISQGHFGVPVSEGTIILVEKAGPGPISTGLASIPTASQFRGCIPTDPCTTLTSQQGKPHQMHDSIHCLHNNGAFLPWHRGYFASMELFLPWHREYFTSVDTLVGGTMCSIESYRGILGVLSTSSIEYKFLLGDGSVRFLGGQEGDDIFIPNAQLDVEVSSAIWTKTLEHGPGMHDSVHCIVGGTIYSARTSNDPVFFSHNPEWFSHNPEWFSHNPEWITLLMPQTLELESGYPLPFAISLETLIVPTDGDDIFMPNAQPDELWGQVIANGLEHGPGMHDSILVLSGEAQITQSQCQGACYVVTTLVLQSETNWPNGLLPAGKDDALK